MIIKIYILLAIDINMVYNTYRQNKIIINPVDTLLEDGKKRRNKNG